MKIAIDPGHGMSNRQMGIYDPGATHSENGFRHEEATIALKYALVLKDVFRAKGHDVFMTRDDAEDHAPVGKRAKNAEAAGCTVFLSLHLNDFDDDAANGLEVLYRDQPDKAFAEELQSELVAITRFKNRGVKQRGDLAVLKFAGTAALIELGFIANDTNRETLLNPQKRMEICEAISRVTLDRFAAPSAGTGAAAGGGQ
jgi:N-acetylmuramoyl-L-alanine amidase